MKKRMDLRWMALRFTVALAALVAAFVDGLGFFLSPGQAVVWAIGSATPHPPDARWGIFLGLVLYAGLAFVSVVMRSRHDEAEDAKTGDSVLDLAA